MTDQNRNLLALSAQIVAAHTAHNEVGIEILPTVIRSVYNTLADLNSPDLRPVAIENTDGEHLGHDHNGHNLRHAHNAYVHPTYGQTVHNDHLICMEDGLTMKML